jgi:hypothetical protein
MIFFNEQTGIEVVGQAADTEQALSLLGTLQPDVILIGGLWCFPQMLTAYQRKNTWKQAHLGPSLKAYSLRIYSTSFSRRNFKKQQHHLAPQQFAGI